MNQEEPIWDQDIPESEDFEAFNAEWNSDGSKIFFEHTDFSDQQNIIQNHIWSYEFATKQRESVYNGRAYNVDVFKQGEKLLFHDPVSPFGVYEFDAESSTTSPITNREGINEYEYVIGGKYSPDYKTILAVIFAGEPRGIIVMDSTGANPRMIVEYGVMAEWFPKGDKIIYVGWSEETQSGQIFEINIDGTNKKQLSSLNNTMNLAGPTVSPDGQKIVFANISEESITELYLLDYESLEIAQITNGEGYANGISWSPMGDKLIFNRIFPDGKRRLYLLDINSYEVEPLFRKGN